VQPRRSAVVVEANLFSRVARVFRSYANAIGAHFVWRQFAAYVAQVACMQHRSALWRQKRPPGCMSPRLMRRATRRVVSKAEDPEKILEQSVNDMQGDLIKMRQASAQARQCLH